MSDGSVVVRFGLLTPYFPLSMAYGMLHDPQDGLWYVSVDHYVNYRMMAREDDRRKVLTSPNSWIATQVVERAMLEAARSGTSAVVHDWERRRDPVMMRALMLKFGQGAAVRALLLKTGRRSIVDRSRPDERHWCDAFGRGLNRHGHLLEAVRGLASSGRVLDVGLDDSDDAMWEMIECGRSYVT